MATELTANIALSPNVMAVSLHSDKAKPVSAVRETNDDNAKNNKSNQNALTSKGGKRKPTVELEGNHHNNNKGDREALTQNVNRRFCVVLDEQEAMPYVEVYCAKSDTLIRQIPVEDLQTFEKSILISKGMFIETKT